jgi:hypothetical protein
MKLPLNVTILLGFAPYIAFFALMRTLSVEAGLAAALIVAVVNAVRDLLGSRSMKVLEIGNVALFAALLIFTLATQWPWTIMSVRLVVDSGLLAIVLISLAIGLPFTLQYARERTSEQVWRTPFFMTVNRRVTWAWAAAFAVLVAMHAAVVLLPAVPAWLDLVVTAVALGGAFRFSTWYPAQARKQAGVAPQS